MQGELVFEMPPLSGHFVVPIDCIFQRSSCDLTFLLRRSGIVIALLKLIQSFVDGQLRVMAQELSHGESVFSICRQA